MNVTCPFQPCNRLTAMLSMSRFCARAGFKGMMMIAIAGMMVLGGMQTSFAQLNDEVPAEVQGVGMDQKPGGQLPLSVDVVDSNGTKRRLAHYFQSERPVLVTLNYSDCPMLCSTQLNQLVASLDQLDLQIGKDFDLLTLSIDPKETTEKISATKAKYIALLPHQTSASSGWHFVTSNSDGIAKVTDALGFRYRYDKVSKQYYHPAMLAYVSPDGVISRYWLDIVVPPEQMKMSIIDTSHGEVGSIVDQFVMLCFSYDSERNRYVASAWKIMRVGAAATVAILLVTLTPFWVHGKRNSKLALEGEPGLSPGAPETAEKSDS